MNDMMGKGMDKGGMDHGGDMGGAPGTAPPPAQPPDAMQAEVQRIASEAPALPKPVQAKRIAALVAQFNATVEALGGKDPGRDEVPDLAWEAPGPKVEGRFPPEVYVPLAVLNLAVANTAKQADLPALVKKYDLDLAGLDTDQGIAYSQAVLKKMAGDKRLAEIMRAPPAPKGAAPPPTDDLAASM